MSQTTVSQNGAAGTRGLLGDIRPMTIQSLAAEEIIPVGYPVKLGTDPSKEVLKATTGAGVIGFAVNGGTLEQTSAGAVQYAATETVPVLKQGTMWALTSDAVVAGASANLTVADGTLTDALVTSGIEALTAVSVTFLTATTAPGLALIEVK